ncbi:MAG TPA: ankyrin repeat domain-containing protein, partial [Gammaproteobacteria bacterium]|nr:ankyrin repeat domain-containing protein [Gammaproteobacteria bacterium]
ESVGRLEEMQFLLDSIGYFEANCLDINSLYLQKKPSLDFEKIIKLIQEHKFFINTQNQDGTTVLILAANQGLVPVVRALLNLGADLHMANMHGSALTWAIVGAQNKRNFTMHKVIELLIQHGLDPNQGINQSVPALIQATELNLLPIVTKLLDLNIDINVKDHTGKTALMVASSLGHDNIVLELMENGVDLHATDASCSNALMYAVINQHEDIVNELVENGINLNAQNNNGYTALMLAVDLGFVDIAKLLLEHNADPNVKDPSGKTALVIAAQKHCSSVITALLLAGADDIEALHYLSSKGMIQEKQFIEKHIRKANVKQANVIFSQRQPSDAQLNETQSATGSKKLQP